MIWKLSKDRKTPTQHNTTNLCNLLRLTEYFENSVFEFYVSGNRKGGVSILDMRTSMQGTSGIVQRLKDHGKEVCGVRLCPGTTYLACGSDSGRVSIWDLRMAQQTYKTIKAHTACAKVTEREDNTSKITCTPSEDSDQPGRRPSLTGFDMRYMETFFRRTTMTLVRLGGCPCWSESLLGAQVIMLILSCYVSIWRTSVELIS